jgi:predicted enzyme related to lactoylglutathione lyase
MPENLKLDYLELPAADLPAIKAFYEAVFAWSFTDYGPEYTAFTDGKMDGGFYQSTLRSRKDNGGVLIVIYAEELRAVRGQVLANGGTILREVYSFPGGHRFHFADPHGNELAVWSERFEPGV